MHRTLGFFLVLDEFWRLNSDACLHCASAVVDVAAAAVAVAVAFAMAAALAFGHGLICPAGPSIRS